MSFLLAILNYFRKKSRLFFGCISNYIVPRVNNSDKEYALFLDSTLIVMKIPKFLLELGVFEGPSCLQIAI